ncbi:MAG: DUF554 domain-containing protein [Enterococcus lemanii]|jgi:uncharacterized membrane protein YqgA involved in biofilm formation
MPIGIIINSIAIFIGGIVGGNIGHLLPNRIKTEMNLILGVASMTMGVYAIAPMKNMPAVIFSVVVGTALGLVFRLGNKMNQGALWMQKPIAKLFSGEQTTLSQEDFLNQLVTIIVLFCASGTGIYGSLDLGMTGDSSVLIAKSILDFFTAMIFAAQLGYVVSVIAIPQFIIFFLLFLGAKMIFPLTTPAMILDFKACGGVLMLATGFRIIQVKMFPVADMIPAMILAMPFSWVWVNWIMPLL